MGMGLVSGISGGTCLRQPLHMSCGPSTTVTLLGCKKLFRLLARVLTWVPRYNPISTEVFDAQVYSMFYGSSASANLIQGDQSFGERLALMFMVLAIGSLMDTTLAAYNLEAEKYYQLARAALFHSSILDAPTLHVVQALVRRSHQFQK